jgi:hypothetical protein
MRPALTWTFLAGAVDVLWGVSMRRRLEHARGEGRALFPMPA